MTSRTATALDQVNHIIDATFSSVEQFEPFDRYTALQSMHTALDRQLKHVLIDQREFDRTRYIVRKLWDLELQIEKDDAKPFDAIGHIITLMLDLYLEGVITRSLFVYVCTYLYKR